MPASSSGSPSQPSSPRALARCAASFQNQLAAVEAANVSLDQWKMHIRAIDEVVAGHLTLRQAQSLWTRTRKGALHKADTFQALADEASQGDCPTGTSAPARLRACQRAGRAYGKAVAAAEDTTHVWEMHIKQMEDLPADTITRQQTHMWRDMWKTGQQLLATYRRDLRRAQQLNCPAWPRHPFPQNKTRGGHAPAMQQLEAKTASSAR
jgi:hypothetical protein